MIPLTYALTRAFDCWLVGVITLAMWATLIAVGPEIESRVWPVVTDYRAVEVKQAVDGAVLVLPEYVKRRECRFTSWVWYQVDAHGRFERVVANPLTPDAPRDFRPVGHHIGPWWRLEPPQPGEVTVYGVLLHSCGWPWETRSPIGPLKLR